MMEGMEMTRATDEGNNFPARRTQTGRKEAVLGAGAAETPAVERRSGGKAPLSAPQRALCHRRQAHPGWQPGLHTRKSIFSSSHFFNDDTKVILCLGLKKGYLCDVRMTKCTMVVLAPYSVLHIIFSRHFLL